MRRLMCLHKNNVEIRGEHQIHTITVNKKIVMIKMENHYLLSFEVKLTTQV